MNGADIADIAVLALVGAALIAAVVYSIRSRARRGGCGCGCQGCSRSCGKNKHRPTR